MKNGSLDLSAEHLTLVKEILRSHVPECRVFVFGSRVMGKAKKTSDIDLALSTDHAIDPMEKAELLDAFDASMLPMKVDIVDLCAVSPEFRKIIESQVVRIL